MIALRNFSEAQGAQLKETSRAKPGRFRTRPSCHAKLRFLGGAETRGAGLSCAEGSGSSRVTIRPLPSNVAERGIDGAQCPPRGTLTLPNS